METNQTTGANQTSQGATLTIIVTTTTTTLLIRHKLGLGLGILFSATPLIITSKVRSNSRGVHDDDDDDKDRCRGGIPMTAPRRSWEGDR